MAVNSRAEVVAAFDAFGDAVSVLADLSFDALTTPERLALLERLEHDVRRLPVARHALINGVRQQATAAEIGGKLSHVLADRLGITRSEANRRIDEAQDLGERRALTGEPLPAQLAATAAAQRAGALGEGHVRVIRRFLRDLPCWIGAPTREHAEAQLAGFAATKRAGTKSLSQNFSGSMKNKKREGLHPPATEIVSTRNLLWQCTTPTQGGIVGRLRATRRDCYSS